jgi:hypothetical protein
VILPHILKTAKLIAPPASGETLQASSYLLKSLAIYAAFGYFYGIQVGVEID